MRVFFNEDDSHFGYYCFANNIEITEKVLKDFIYIYKDSDVTDFLINLNCSVSGPDSEIFQSYSDKYEATSENGRPVDFKNTFVKVYHDAIRVKKLDMYKIWIDTLREINIRPWLSFRMNDVHESFVEASPVKSEYTDAHPDHWITKNRPPIAYFDRCLDYGVPEVRDRMYNYIKEQLLRYDVDGIELDFGRELYFFTPGKQDAAVMTEFIAKVKALVDTVSKERNKKIEICMINPASPITAYNVGFDVAEIVNRGLVDILVASPRFDTINTNIPLKVWRGIVGNKVQLGGMQQLLVNSTSNIKPVHSDLEMAFGQAAAYVSRGADFVYLYNCMYSDSAFENIPETSILEINNNKYIINNIGKTENLDRWTRRCPLTFDDSVTRHEPLAVSLPQALISKANRPFKVATGKFKKEQKAYVILSFEEPVNPENLTVWTNDTEAKFVPEHKEDKYILPNNAYTFEMAISTEDSVVVEIIPQQDCTINYVEVLIEGIK